MNRGLPWTVHLNGIAAILEQQKLYTYSNGHVKEHTSFLGVLDLPIHKLGRKTQVRNIWYTYCRFQSGIDVITGLPCSLIDLLSTINEPRVMALLADWKMEDGSATRRKVWGVTRHAAIVVGLERHDPYLLDGSQVRRVIDLLQKLRATIRDDTCKVRTTLLFPLVIAGIHPSSLTELDMSSIVGCIVDVADGSLETYPYYKGAVCILQEFWYRSNGRSAERIAQNLDLKQFLI